MASVNYSAVVFTRHNDTSLTLKPPDGIIESFGSVETDFDDDFNGTVSYGILTGTEPYWDRPTTIILCVILSILIILSIGGNLLVISVVIRHRGMRTRTNMFLVNLAVADFLVGLVPMPISLITVVHGRWIFSDTICGINGFLNALCLITSNQLLMYISIHKYFSITRPFSRFLTVRKIIMMIAAAWLWATLCSVLTVTGLQKVMYKNGTMHCGPAYPRDLLAYIHHAIIQVTDIFIPLGVMFICYTRIFIEIRQHVKRMRANSTLEKDTILAQQKKVTITLFIVLACFVCCWLPYHIYASYVSYQKNKHGYPPIINALAYTFGYLNSACNPIIYALRSPSFREGYMEILCRKSAVIVSDDTIHPSTPSSFKRRFSAFIGSVKGSVNGSIRRSRSGSEVSRCGVEIEGVAQGSRHSSTSSLAKIYSPREKKTSFSQLIKQASRNGKGNSIIKRDGSVVIMKDGKIVCVRQQGPCKSARPSLPSTKEISETLIQPEDENENECNGDDSAFRTESRPLLQNGHTPAIKTDSGFQEDRCSSHGSDLLVPLEAPCASIAGSSHLLEKLDLQQSWDTISSDDKGGNQECVSEKSLTDILCNASTGDLSVSHSSEFGHSTPNIAGVKIMIQPSENLWPHAVLAPSRSTDYLATEKLCPLSKVRLTKSDQCLDRHPKKNPEMPIVHKSKGATRARPKAGEMVRVPSVEHLDIPTFRGRCNSETRLKKKSSPNVKRRSWFGFKHRTAARGQDKLSRSKDNGLPV